MRSWKRLLAALLVMAMLVPMTTALSEELPVNASDVLAIEYQEAPQEDAEPAAANTATGEEPGALPEEVEAQLSENGIAANDSDAPAAQTYELTVDPVAKVQTFTMSVNDTLRLRLSEGTADGWSTTKKNVVTFTPSGDYTDVRADAEAKKIKLTTKVTGASKKTASVNLVINNPYTPTGVTLADMPEWVPVGATINLPEKVVLTPTYAVTTLAYKATGAGKVTKEGVFTASKAGKAKITVTPSNNKKIKYTYTLPVLGNKVDKMNGKPSAGDIAAVAGGWTLWPVMIGVNKKGSLDLHVQLLNGTGDKVTQIENMTLTLAVGGKKNIISQQHFDVLKVSCAKGKSKLLKLTLPAPADMTGVFFPEHYEKNTLYIDINSDSVRLKGKAGNYAFVPTRFPIRVPVSGIDIEAPSAPLMPGDTLALTAVVLPEDADDMELSWSSSNAAVATVDPVTGVVTAVAVGEATITATAADGSGVSGSCTIVVSDASPITLTVSRSELVAGESATLYFYAKLDHSLADVANVRLYVENDALVSEMLDDGKYSVSGDDIQNDNTFSARVDIDSAVEGVYQYCAVVNDSIQSNVAKVTVIKNLSASDMQQVDQKLSDVIGNADYSARTVEEKKTVIGQALNDLQAAGEIVPDSIEYNEAAATFAFEYTNGVLGGVVLEDFIEEVNGPVAASVPSAEHETQRRPIFSNGGFDGIVLANDAGSSAGIGKATILFGFENTASRLDFYQKTAVPDWESAGLSTSFVKNATVDDFLAMDGTKSNVYIIAMHGTTYGTSPCICLNESLSDSKDSAYSIPLSHNTVAKLYYSDGTSGYGILPAFFQRELGSNALKNTFIFSECCCFLGESDTAYTTRMPDAMVARGASAVVGFYNSVYADYSRNFMKHYVDRLIQGDTSKAAFEDCKELYGSTDSKFVIDWILGHAPAVPHLFGDGSAVLVGSDFINGSFELDSRPIGWNTTGDVRVISRIGSFIPPHGSNMILLTTGIGSAESTYLAGTEGSILLQSVRIPGDRSTLSFDYNVISEEPMEYVDSEYDDKFIVTLLDQSGNVLDTLASETINTSEWYETSGINFEEGDDTVYHTGWKTVTFDVSPYRNKIVTFRAVVYDVGDSIYDTAAIMDRVALK